MRAGAPRMAYAIPGRVVYGGGSYLRVRRFRFRRFRRSRRAGRVRPQGAQERLMPPHKIFFLLALGGHRWPHGGFWQVRH